MPRATAPSVQGPEPDAPPSLGFERLPVCSEPWQSLYILRRGLRPCCYGGDPVGPMNGFRDAWNAPLLQGIRASLRQGVFHDYCLRSPACPIVEKARHAGAAVPRGGWQVRAWRAWVMLNRATGGVPRRLLGRLRSQSR